jgi:microsomal dipeptidase-like Zn-dependent dipeptidase
MATEQKIPVFDGHNDVLLRLWSSDASAPEKRFLDGENVGHIDLPRALKGGLGGGFARGCALAFTRTRYQRQSRDAQPDGCHEGNACHVGNPAKNRTSL